MQKIGIRTMATNLLHNWYFPIGAVGFYCAMIPWYDGGGHIPEGLIPAVFLCTIIAALSSSLWERVNCANWKMKAFAAITAVGVFWDPMVVPQGGVSFGREVDFLFYLTDENLVPAILIELLAVLAWVFAFINITLLYERLAEIIRDTGLLQNITIQEIATYSVLLLASAVFIFLVFSQTRAFYGRGDGGAIIYNSDSYLIASDGAYVTLFHNENDIRQPLFAIFAAPLTGWAYFLGCFAYKWPMLQMVLLDFSQVVLIFFGGFILARMLELTPEKRICFMVVFCFSYMYILFILMMEQYAVAFFWLVLAIYLVWCNKRDLMVLMGAGGTLITSLALVPLAQKKDPRKNFWGWLWDCAKCGFTYAGMVIACCRLDVILELKEKMEILGSFTGAKLTIWNKILQYLYFARSCFIAPKAYVDLIGEGCPAWWQEPVTSISVVGVILILMTAVSLWLNRKKHSSRLCGYWIAFSVIVLVLVGWGTFENGTMLYGLYFGWAYFVLLFQLAQWLSERLNIAWLLPVLGAVAVVLMIYVNIPQTGSMIQFAITYYPG